MSTVKEKKKKEKKIQYKRWRFRETWNKKHSLALNLRPYGPYRSPEKSPSAPMDSKQAEFSQFYLFLISKIKYEEVK